MSMPPFAEPPPGHAEEEPRLGPGAAMLIRVLVALPPRGTEIGYRQLLRALDDVPDRVLGLLADEILELVNRREIAALQPSVPEIRRMALAAMRMGRRVAAFRTERHRTARRA